MAIARDEVQTLTITATGGTYTLTSAYGTTSALAWNATALAITAALNAVATTPPFATRVTGSASPYTVRFKGPTTRHATHPLLVAGTGSLTGGTATVVRTVTGQAGDRTSIRMTNRKAFVSVNGLGGDTSSVMADATSFTFFVRMRLRYVAGDSIVGGLTDDTTGGHAGPTIALGMVPQGLDGNGRPVYVVQLYVAVNNGSANQMHNFNLAYPTVPASGHSDLVLAVTGQVVGNNWVFTYYDNGQRVAGTNIGPADHLVLGKLGGQTRVVLGCAGNYPGADAHDNNYDDFCIWKDQILTPAEMFDLTNDIRDVEDLYPDRLVVCIDGDGEVGQVAGAGTTTGDGGVINRAGLAFDTADALTVHLGSATYDEHLVPRPIIPLEATVFRSGKTIAFRMVPPEGASSITGIGDNNAPYPPPTTHPTISVNGGPDTALFNPWYLRFNGPIYLIYALTGVNGPLAAPVQAGDEVTFTIAKAWLSAEVDGTLARTLDYADEPATVEVGVPFTLPPGRTLKFGQNPWLRTLRSSFRIEGFGDDGGLNDVTSQVTVTLNGNAFRSPGLGWGKDDNAELRYGYPNLPPGRYCLTWEGVYNFGVAAQDDRIEDLGAANSYGTHANKPVSFLDTTIDGRVDLEPVEGAGTAADPHRAYFTVAYLTGTQGHACVDSQLPDDFVRPSPAVATYLQFRAFGASAGGTSGPRTRLNLYHLGPVGALWYDPADGPEAIPEFYPPIVQCLTDARAAILRSHYDVFDACQASPPSLDFISRWDDPTRTIRSYPEYPAGPVDVAITSVADYVITGPDDPNAALRLGSGTHGALLVVTTAAPHQLREGSMFSLIGGPARLAVADNGSSHPNDVGFRNGGGIAWDWEFLIPQRIFSPTQFLLYAATHHGLTAHVQLATSPMAAPLGRVVLHWATSYVLPEEMLRLAGTVGCEKCWVSMPNAFDDADVTEVFARLAANMADNDVDLLVEQGNETWNDMFYPSEWIKAQATSMPGSGAAFAGTVSGGALVSATVTAPGSGYFYGHEGWYDLVITGSNTTPAGARAHFVDGAADHVTVLAGGSGYTTATLALPACNAIRTPSAEGRMRIMAVMVHRLRKLGRAALAAATPPIDPGRIKGAVSIQNFFTGMAAEFLDYWEAAEPAWPTDDLFFCPTNYDGCSFGPSAPAEANPLTDPHRFKADDADQIIDRNIAFYRWYGGGTVQAGLFKDWAVSAGYGDIPIYSYEGGITTVIDNHDSLDPYTSAASSAEWHANWNPSWKAISHPRYYEVEAERAMRLEGSMDIDTRFNYGGDANGYDRWIDMWSMTHVPAMQAGHGDGSDGKFDNRTDPFAWNDVVSVQMQFFGDWNGGTTMDGPLALGVASASAITDTTFLITCPDATGGTPPYTLYSHELFYSGDWHPAGSGQMQSFGGLTPGTTYPTRVIVTDSDSDTATSPELEVTTTGGPLLTGPPAASLITDTTYRVTAATPTGGTPPYVVMHQRFDGSDFVDVSTDDPLDVTGASPATAYLHRVTVTDAFTTIGSAHLTVTTLAQQPLASGPPVASAITDTSYTMTAATPTGGTPPYSIVHDRFVDGGWVAEHSGPVWNRTGATPDTAYDHRVTVYDSADPYATVTSATTTVTTTGGEPPPSGARPVVRLARRSAGQLLGL